MYSKLMISQRKSQAHCLVPRADTPPKPDKELAFPTQGLTRIKHETLTSCISNGGGCSVFERSTSHKVHRIL